MLNDLFQHRQQFTNVGHFFIVQQNIQILKHNNLLFQIVDKVKQDSLENNTYIFFIGDNGNTQRTSQITNRDHAKGTVYQYGVHEPFIISGPSVVNPGRASKALVNTADLFATIQEFPALSICYTYSDPYRCTKFGNHCYKILMIDTILRGFKND